LNDEALHFYGPSCFKKIIGQFAPTSEAPAGAAQRPLAVSGILVIGAKAGTKSQHLLLRIVLINSIGRP
jgi:hypothetical protein